MARKRTPGDSERRRDDDYWAEQRKRLKYGELKPEAGLEDADFAPTEMPREYSSKIKRMAEDGPPLARMAADAAPYMSLAGPAGMVRSGAKKLLEKGTAKRIRKEVEGLGGDEATVQAGLKFYEDLPDKLTGSEKRKRLRRFVKGEGDPMLKRSAADKHGMREFEQFEDISGPSIHLEKRKFDRKLADDEINAERAVQEQTDYLKRLRERRKNRGGE